MLLAVILNSDRASWLSLEVKYLSKHTDVKDFNMLSIFLSGYDKLQSINWQLYGKGRWFQQLHVKISAHSKYVSENDLKRFFAYLGNVGVKYKAEVTWNLIRS